MARTVYQRALPFKGDAFDIFWVFKDRPNVFFLDSSLRRSRSNFSYIGFEPFLTLRGRDLDKVKQAFVRYRMPRRYLLFPAGAVGYMGYDGELFFGFYDTIVAVDHQRHQLVISSLELSRLKDVLGQLKRQVVPAEILRNKQTSELLEIKSNFTKPEYMRSVNQALEHIRRGDIYQINLSHQIKASPMKGCCFQEPAAIYGNLRHSFPSEFGAYFHDGAQAVLSASPERFLRLQEGTVQVKPMKGTRPRGRTGIEDKLYKAQLYKSPKEIAELLMVTDLERNDLGRVCDFASVKVKAMRTIETYSSVFQATSTIEGRLRPECDQFDLLRATFPSGSVTGCPKIEAMKIIKRLEHGPRGLYTGALGYMSFSGDMDFNVMIRSLFVKPRQVCLHVGGGIVADSKPLDEWQETWDKAKPLIEALKRSIQ